MVQARVIYQERERVTLAAFTMVFKFLAFAALAALMGADAFVSPVATSFSGSAVAQRVRLSSRGQQHDEIADECVWLFV